MHDDLAKNWPPVALWSPWLCSCWTPFLQDVPGAWMTQMDLRIVSNTFLKANWVLFWFPEALPAVLLVFCNIVWIILSMVFYRLSFSIWTFSLDYISHMDYIKDVQLLVWMGEMFSTWGAALSSISGLCGPFLLRDVQIQTPTELLVPPVSFPPLQPPPGSSRAGKR